MNKRFFILVILLNLPVLVFPIHAQEKPSNPYSPAYHRRLGELHFREKKYTEAEKAFQNALSLAKNKADKSRLHEMLAQVYDKTRNHQNRIQSLEKAINSETSGTPRFTLLSNRLVKAYLQINKPDKAEKAARKAIPLATRIGDKLALWEAVCLIHKGKKTLDELLKECDTSKDKKPALLTLLMAKKIFHSMGNHKEIEKNNQKIVQHYPYEITARRDLAESLLGAGKQKEALAHFEFLASSLSNDRNLYAQRLVEEYLALGNDDKAKKWMEFLKRPNSTVSLKLANILAKAKKYDQALKELDQAIQNANSVHEACRARLEKAKMLDRLNRKPDAVKECEIIENLPGRPDWAGEQAKNLKKNLQRK